MNTFKMLVAEHDQEISNFLSERLSGAGYEVRTAATGRTALTLLETTIFDTALIAVDLPDMLGIELLEVATRRDPEMDIVLLTGLSELETAVQALRLGAYAYLIKPLDWTSLHHCVKQMIERRYLRQELAYLRSRLASDPQVGDLIGSSPRMVYLKDSIAKAGPADSAVLLEGESGTGKELVATAIHRSSARRDGPFITVNCAAIPADFMEEELFGDRKGAISRADGGTLFLDHIDELPAPIQPRVMRVLQAKEISPAGNVQAQTVDVRIVSATNKNLAEAVQAGRFRQDLFLFLNASRIETPPLREVKEDIGSLAMHFIRRFNRMFGRRIASVAPDAMAALMTYDFPGNTRELENIIERAYALGANEEIRFADLPSLILERRSPAAASASLPSQSLDEFERELIVATLRTYGNDKEKVAQALGMSERTLYRRLKKLGV